MGSGSSDPCDEAVDCADDELVSDAGAFTDGVEGVGTEKSESMPAIMASSMSSSFDDPDPLPVEYKLAWLARSHVRVICVWVVRTAANQAKYSNRHEMESISSQV